MSTVIRGQVLSAETLSDLLRKIREMSR